MQVQIVLDAGSPNRQAIAADQYTESIPLTETRDYVKHVMTNATHYGLLIGTRTAIN